MTTPDFEALIKKHIPEGKRNSQRLTFESVGEEGKGPTHLLIYDENTGAFTDIGEPETAVRHGLITRKKETRPRRR